MLRNLKTLTVGAAVLATGLVWNAPEAEAFWGHSSGGSYGSWGSSGGSWGSSGGSYGSYGGGYYPGSYGSYGGGSYGGWGGGHRHHHHRRQAYYGSWGSSGGSWGSSGGYYASWGSSGGSWGSSGGSYGSMGGVIVDGGAISTTPSIPASPPPAHPSDMPGDGGPQPGPGADMDTAPNPPVDNGAGLYRRPTSATLTVQVPADARVFVNGLATTSTGTVRRYVSNGLREGFNYTYQVRAEIVRNGQTITETQTVKLQAGEAPSVEFALNGSESEPIANQPVRTNVTLHVPADAKVYLSGNDTHGTGEVRTFSTTQLAAGQTWGDYVVRVEVQRNGRTLSKQETIAIKGGESSELTVDFDAPQVARASN
jgi:uncharacterized protein (TIGR03000 family)